MDGIRMKEKDNSSLKQSLYSVHPAVSMIQTVIRNLPENTGRSLNEWIQLVRESGPAGEKEQRAWLKNEYKLGGTTVSLIVDHTSGKGTELASPESYLKAAPAFVDAMYSGQKAGLRPIHEELIRIGRALGPDVKICPTKTTVPFYRKNVFAQIKPTTQTRIDFGLALKNARKSHSPRLIDTGGLAKGDRITHRFAISSLEDIDEEVREWFKIAYDL